MPMVADSSGLIAMGLSHHTAPVEMRERFALSTERVAEELSELRASHLIREALWVNTCNRVELYAVPGETGPETLRERWLRRFGVTGDVSAMLYQHHDLAAVRHLFRVASSLDSLVVGEPQILGQVKTAVRIATDVGTLGAVLHRLAQRTFWVAKQVRSQTEIGRSTVGVGNAGVHLAEQIFTDLKGRRALLIGTGEMGRQVAKAMVKRGLAELIVASRTFEHAISLASTIGATPIRMELADDYLPRVDVVIVATSASKPVLSAASVRSALRARRNAPIFLVDLSVPRNIDPEINQLDSAYLFNIDDLRRVTDRGALARQSAASDAEQLVAREAERFAVRLADLSVNDRLGDVVRHVESLRLEERARSRHLLEGLDPVQQEAVDAMMRAFAKKVLHDPLRHARHAARQGDLAAADTILSAWERGGVDEDDWLMDPQD